MFGPSLALIPLVLPPCCPLLSSSLHGPSLLSLHHRHRCSTRDPPHEQLLVRLGAGDMSSFIIVLSPHCSLSLVVGRRHHWSLSVVIVSHCCQSSVISHCCQSSSSLLLSLSVVVVIVIVIVSHCHHGQSLSSWSVIVVVVSHCGCGRSLWLWSVIIVVSRGRRCLPSLTAHCCCLCLVVIPPTIHPTSSCS
jgi:hypothetical protein